MSGRVTLTTTSRPSCSAAVCTCAMDAAAKGCSSKRANSVEILAFNDCSIRVLATSLLKGLTRSCNKTNCCNSSGGIKSRRVESNCPILIASGPISSTASLSLSGFFFSLLDQAAGCMRINAKA